MEAAAGAEKQSGVFQLLSQHSTILPLKFGMTFSNVVERGKIGGKVDYLTARQLRLFKQPPQQRFPRATS